MNNNNEHSHKNQLLLYNLINSFSVTISNGLVNIIYPLGIGIFLGPQIFGLYAIVISFIYLTTLVSDSGLSPAILRFVASTGPTEKGKVISTGWIMWISLLIFSLFLLYLLGSNFLFNEPFLFISVIFTIILTSLHRFIRKIIQGLEDFGLITKFEYLSIFAMILTLIVFLIFRINISISLLLLPINIYHILFILLTLVYLPSIREFSSIEKKLFVKLFRYSILVGLGSIFSLGLNYFQILFASLEFSIFETGQLAFWAYFLYPFIIISQSFNAILIPRVTAMLNNDSINPFNLIRNISIFLTQIIISGLLMIVFLYLLFIDFITTIPFEYFQNNGIILGILYLSSGGFAVIFGSLLSILVSYESRVIFNPIIAFINAIFVVFLWLIGKETFGILIIPLALFIGSYISLLALIAIINVLEGNFSISLPFIPSLYIIIAVIVLILPKSLISLLKPIIILILPMIFIFMIRRFIFLINVLKNDSTLQIS